MTEKIIRLNSVDQYCQLFGLPDGHPLIRVVDLKDATRWPTHFTIHYGVYALFLKDTRCGDIRYGKQTYDYQEGTVTSFAPGQVVETIMEEGTRPKALGLLFHPDLIQGTALAREIKTYSFFSYASSEALHLSEEEKVVIKALYNQALAEFKNNEIVQSIIKNIKLDTLESMQLGETEIQAKDDVLQSISTKLEIIHDLIPLSFAGTGTQNLIQAALYLDSKNSVQTLLIEEPENNLSFSNLHRLIQIIRKGGQQVFITTHSSYITNHLGLNNVLLIHNGQAISFNNLDDSDTEFFHKLPGYDTLRFVLSSKVILTEGPSDELLITKAYIDIKGKDPKQNGIDIFAVNGLVFKRFCAIAAMLNKRVAIVTDNDGDVEALKKRYADILKNPLFSIFYDKNNCLNTLEPSVVSANSGSPEDFKRFLSIISPENEMNEDTLVKYMKNDKTDWAMKVLESTVKIKYPSHIHEAVEWWSD